MAVEEITLHPVRLPKLVKRTEASPEDDPGPEDLNPIVRDYMAAIRLRDRFALSTKSQQRNQDRFDLRLKTLVKTMATQASSRVRDHDSRTVIRTEIYTLTMMLVQALSEDQRVRLRKSRRIMKWGSMLGVLGILSILTTAFLNDWIQITLS